MELQKMNKKARSCMYFTSIIGMVIILAIVITVYYLASKDASTFGDGTKWVKLGCIIVLVAEVLETIFSPMIRYNRYRYILTEEEIQIREGIWFITHTIVPISRLHKIKVDEGPIDRMFKLAKVEVITAGGDVTIKFLEKEKALQIANKLKNRINVIVEESNEDEE